MLSERSSNSSSCKEEGRRTRLRERGDVGGSAAHSAGSLRVRLLCTGVLNPLHRGNLDRQLGCDEVFRLICFDVQFFTVLCVEHLLCSGTLRIVGSAAAMSESEHAFRTKERPRGKNSE